MRVGYDVTPALVDRAGVGRYTTELLGALRRTDGVEVERLASSARRPATSLNRIAEGLRRELLYYPVALSRRARDTDLVHVPAVYAARVAGRPLVVTFHDVLALRYPELFTRRVATYIRGVARLMARRATRITVPSEYTRSEVIELLGAEPEHVTVTSEGVHERFVPTERDERWLHERFGIDGPFVLSVGTLEPRKNLVTALRAFARVQDRCTLVLAGGSGWRNEELHAEIANTRGRVVLTGFVTDDELVRLYGSAACFVYPSLYEGFGLPPLEAMACGAPVVASNTASVPEVVGDAGLLVDPHDADALADAVRAVLDDSALAYRLGERGVERSRAFTWERTARATAGVYRDALA